MILLTLPDNKQRQLPFYLAMEEYATTLSCLNYDDLFFMWRVRPTVIYGRCQIGSREVDLKYCRENNIEVYRRKSGGGCVYADNDNIMFSYLTKRTDSTTSIFSNYTSKVASFLQSLGLNSSATERNDVLVDDKKVSGNAFYNCRGASIVHGTMLYNTNIAHMTNALTPSKLKTSSKGIKSVENRITTLNKYLSISIEEFMQLAKEYLCESTYGLSAIDIAEIDQISEQYYSDKWRYGLDLKQGILFNKRIEGVGEFYIDLNLSKDKIIENIEIGGDFFVVGDISKLLINPLIGLNLSRGNIAEALSDINVSNVISGLTNEQYINLLIESNHE